MTFKTFTQAEDKRFNFLKLILAAIIVVITTSYLYFSISVKTDSIEIVYENENLPKEKSQLNSKLISRKLSSMISASNDFDYTDRYPSQPIISTFNASGIDTLVFVHIQKTGGSTVERHFADNLAYPKCVKVPNHKKQRRCPRPDNNSDTWNFSRFTGKEWECGLHADWVELQECAEERLNQLFGEKKRKLHFTTSLRSPVLRFLSEWKHVQRGATWKDSTLRCGNDKHSHLLRKCFNGKDWSNVSLEEFLDCDQNLGFNRQTRMLADLSLVGCYSNIFNLTEANLDRIMLDSAKENLFKMRWFGLVEYQKASQFLFEAAFYPLHFVEPFKNWNSTYGEIELKQLKPKLLTKIQQRNELDIELYEYAQRLFFQRLKHFTAS